MCLCILVEASQALVILVLPLNGQGNSVNTEVVEDRVDRTKWKNGMCAWDYVAFNHIYSRR